MSAEKPKTILVKKPNLPQTDCYRKLASTKFGVPYESVTKEMRQKVKTWELFKAYEIPYSKFQDIFGNTGEDRIKNVRKILVGNYEEQVFQ
jgi:hypothetical protein